MPTFLDIETVLEMKKVLWNGMSHDRVAAIFDISQTHVSRICNGRAWPEIEWPDRTIGGMKPERKMQIWRGRKKNSWIPERVADPKTKALAATVAEKVAEIMARGGLTEKEREEIGFGSEDEKT